MHIRPYRDTDKQAVIDLIVPIQNQEFGLPITAEDQPDLSDIPGFYQQGTGNFWVAVEQAGGEGESEETETIIGTISLLDIGNKQVAMRKVFVAAPHRGKRADGTPGAAAQLLATSLDWARQQGIAAIYLGTTPYYHAAHRFYKKHGFAEIPQSTLPSAFPVMSVDKKFYMLPISVR